MKIVNFFIYAMLKTFVFILCPHLTKYVKHKHNSIFFCTTWTRVNILNIILLGEYCNQIILLKKILGLNCSASKRKPTNLGLLLSFYLFMSI